MTRKVKHISFNGIEFKQCCYCKLWLPLFIFSKDKSNWDDLSTKCKRCCYLKTRSKIKPRVRINHKIIEGINYKYCKKCDTWLPLFNNFQVKSDMWDGFKSCCKKCGLGVSRKWQKNNPHIRAKIDKTYAKKYPKIIARRKKKWQQENRDRCNASGAKRRAKKKNQTPKNANFEIIQMYYTVSSEWSDAKFCNCLYEVDHIIPINFGGLHHENNLQILSAKLNHEKQDKYPLTKEEEIRYKGWKL